MRLAHRLPVPENVSADIFPYIRRAFETVSTATTSTSAADARTLGFLREVDSITPNRDHTIADAKRTVIAMAEQGFRPPQPRRAVRVAGLRGLAKLGMAIHQFRDANDISEYDAKLATSLATVLCGGEVDSDVRVNEEHFLDLEREHFLKLCGEPKTLERIEHMLKTGKPLRN